ncbi:hypothetical protein, partial [Glycomyces tenuis]
MTGQADRAPEFYRIPRDWSDREGRKSGPPVSLPRRDPTLATSRHAPPLPLTAQFFVAEHVGRDQIHAGRDSHTYHFQSTPENIGDIVADLQRRTRYSTEWGSMARELEHVVPPPQLDEHLGVLLNRNVLVLCAEPRTGLSTAITHRALKFARQHRLGVERIFIEAAKDLHRSVDDLETPTLLVLDISDDGELGRELAKALPQIQAALHAHRSHLIIALGHEHFQAADATLPGSVFELRRPSAEAVLTACLRGSDGEGYLKEFLAHDRFKRHLADSWPPRMAKLAEMIKNAGPGLSMDHLFDRVLDGLDDWRQDLHRRFETEINPISRALLVAAAVLEFSPIESVVKATRRFLELVDYQEDRPHLLEEPSLTAEFAQLTEVFDPARSTFRRPGYAAAVVPHVWIEYPRWRSPLKTWFIELLQYPKYLDEQGLGRVIVAFVALASAANDSELVTKTVTEQLGDDVDLGAQLLLRGALDTVIGKEVRRSLWNQAYYANASTSRQLMLAKVCGAPAYAERFPNNALYRLQHLAKSEDASVQQAVVTAVSNVSLHHRPRILLIRFTSWLDPSGPSQLPHMVPRMIDAVYRRTEFQERLRHDPDALNTDPGGHVATFWQRLFRTATPTEARSAA